MAVIPDISGSAEAFHAAAHPADTSVAVPVVAAYATELSLVPSAVLAVRMNTSPASTNEGVKTVCRRSACVSFGPPLLELAETVKGIPMLLPVSLMVPLTLAAVIVATSGLVEAFH